MILMDFGILKFLNRQKIPQKNYLALRVGISAVTAGIWTVSNGKTTITKTQTTEIISTKVEDLMAAVDHVVSAVSENQSVEVKEILFGVPPDWIIDGKLDDLQLTALRRICKEMGLIPLGFVSLPESIVNYYKEIESTPLTAIIVGIDTGKLYLTLVRAGKIVANQVVIIVPDQPFGVLIEEGIKKFPEAEVLPSRILIYDGVTDLQKLESEIIAYPWTQKLQFLHFPKVESVESAKVCEAIAYAGGSQIGEKMEVIEELEPLVQTAVAVTEPAVEKPKIALPKINLPKFNIIFPIIGVISIILLICGYFAIGFFTSTDVVLTVNSKQIEETKDIDATKVVGQKVENTASGTKKVVTTGKKIVGDKAKGTVTIYGTTIGRTFPAGTVIIGKNLKFYTDNAVTIASGSAATAATVTVNVTATGIGESFNLPSGTLFDLGDYPSSSYQAKNDMAFSGGSSRSISIVTKSDQDKLLAALTDQLIIQSKEQLKSQVPVDQQLLDQAITTSVIKKIFDKKIDEESDGVSLDLSIKITGVLVDQKLLIAMIPDLYKDKIPDGYEFLPERASATIVSSKIDKTNAIILNIKFLATLLPKIDKVQLAKNISGQSIVAAQKIILVDKNISKAEINISPKILAGLSPVSRNSSKIKISLITP